MMESPRRNSLIFYIRMQMKRTKKYVSPRIKDHHVQDAGNNLSSMTDMLIKHVDKRHVTITLKSNYFFVQFHV